MASEPLAVYRVRTAAGYWLVAVMLFALAVVGGAAMAFVVATTGGNLVWPFVIAVGISALAPLAYWLCTEPYRVAGGAGEIRFFADRLELPGEPSVFPRDSLRVEAREMRIRYRVAALQAATVRRGHLVTLRAGDRVRRLSTLTLEQPRAFLADLERYVGDGVPRGTDRGLGA